MRQLALAGVLVAALVLAAGGAAHPAGVPIERLNALISTIQDLEKVEQSADQAYRDYAFRKGGDKAKKKAAVEKAIKDMDTARAIVRKELRKAEAEGLKPDYKRELDASLRNIGEHDDMYEQNWDKPFSALKYSVQEPDTAMLMAGDAKSFMIALLQRYTKRAAAPVVPFEHPIEGVLSAITDEEAAKSALRKSPPDVAGATKLIEKSMSTLEQASGDTHSLDDHDLIRESDGSKLQSELQKGGNADYDARTALRKGDAKEAATKLDDALERKRDYLRIIEKAMANPPPKAPEPKADKDGPACTPGTWTSGAIEFAAPGPHGSPLYYAETPIPNRDYYTAKRGFKSGGCDLVGGHLEANIDVYDSTGALTAWNYQFGTPPRPNQTDPPVKTHSGEDCITTSKDESGAVSVHHSCLIDSPRLAYRLPKQGFELPFGGITQDSSAFKVFAVVFTVEGRGTGEGTPGKVTVKVAWQVTK